MTVRSLPIKVERLVPIRNFAIMARPNYPARLRPLSTLWPQKNRHAPAGVELSHQRPCIASGEVHLSWVGLEASREPQMTFSDDNRRPNHKTDNTMLVLYAIVAILGLVGLLYVTVT